MLVQCQACGVQFPFGKDRCISCGERYRSRPEDYEPAVVPRVVNWLLSRMTEQSVRCELIKQFDIPPTDAEEILRLARATIRTRNREHGGKVAISGLALIVVSAVIFALTGGIVFAIGAAFLGLAMLVFGLFKRITGWNITGHDGPFYGFYSQRSNR